MFNGLERDDQLKPTDELTQTSIELGIKSQDLSAIAAFLEPLKAKDNDTYEHCLRVGKLAREIGRFLHFDERSLFIAGLLHDLGKTEIPLDLLRKTDGWTEEDSKRMKAHVLYGYEKIKGRFDFAAEIILLHHRFQKDKYPEILPQFLHNYSQETIDLIFKHARILVLADIYDALHRNDNKFGDCRRLTGAEIKNQMLELNPDKCDLVEMLYEQGIFREN